MKFSLKSAFILAALALATTSHAYLEEIAHSVSEAGGDVVEEAKDGVETLYDNVRNGRIGEIYADLKKAAGDVRDELEDGYESVRDNVRSSHRRRKRHFSDNLRQATGDVVSEVKDGIETVYEDIREGNYKSAASNIKQAAGAIYEEIKDGYETAQDDVRSFKLLNRRWAEKPARETRGNRHLRKRQWGILSGAIGKVGSVASYAGSKIGGAASTVANTATSAGSSVMSGVRGASSTLANTGSSAFSKVRGAFGGGSAAGAAGGVATEAGEVAAKKALSRETLTKAGIGLVGGATVGAVASHHFKKRPAEGEHLETEQGFPRDLNFDARDIADPTLAAFPLANPAIADPTFGNPVFGQPVLPLAML